MFEYGTMVVDCYIVVIATEQVATDHGFTSKV